MYRIMLETSKELFKSANLAYSIQKSYSVYQNGVEEPTMVALCSGNEGNILIKRSYDWNQSSFYSINVSESCGWVD